MPLQIDPRAFGFANLESLATTAGTLQGEAGNQGLAGRARIVDLARNRSIDPQFAYRNTYTDPTTEGGSYTYTGIAAQLSNPKEFSTWRTSDPSRAHALSMNNLIMDIGRDPSLYDRLSPGQQRQVDLNLSAIRGVLGTGEFAGSAGGATFYSTGRGLSDAIRAEHEGYGLNGGVYRDGHYWYGGGEDNSRLIGNRIANFDWNTATDNFVTNSTRDQFSPAARFGDPNYRSTVSTDLENPLNFWARQNNVGLGVRDATSLGIEGDESGAVFGRDRPTFNDPNRPNSMGWDTFWRPLDSDQGEIADPFGESLSGGLPTTIDPRGFRFDRSGQLQTPFSRPNDAGTPNGSGRIPERLTPLTSQDALRGLYEGVLGRDPASPDELSGWDGMLRGGNSSLADVAEQIARSAEGQ